MSSELAVCETLVSPLVQVKFPVIAWVEPRVCSATARANDNVLMFLRSTSQRRSKLLGKRLVMKIGMLLQEDGKSCV